MYKFESSQIPSIQSHNDEVEELKKLDLSEEDKKILSHLKIEEFDELTTDEHEKKYKISDFPAYPSLEQ